MYYSVQPSHLHYTDVMLGKYHVWFGLAALALCYSLH